ncbi:hypothetical protein IRJ41_018018, partial [Triplophysa rosa]
CHHAFPSLFRLPLSTDFKYGKPLPPPAYRQNRSRRCLVPAVSAVEICILIWQTIACKFPHLSDISGQALHHFMVSPWSLPWPEVIARLGSCQASPEGPQCLRVAVLSKGVMERDVVSAPLLGLGMDVVSAGHVYILQGSEHSQGTVLRLFTHLCDGAV